ncbi:hypothetical protein [Legionella sp. WA2024007413]
MQSNLEINMSYEVWKKQYIKKLEEDRSGRHAFQNKFYGILLIETLENNCPEHLSIKVNQDFITLVNKYHFELRAAYGYEWEKSKLEASKHPKFVEFMEELKKKGCLLKPEIKKFAPLLAQAQRTSSSFFGKLPSDLLNLIANFLEPQLSFVDASKKLNEELQKAQTFFDQIRFFTFDVNNIVFSQNTGTHVPLTVYEPFQNWFSELPIREHIPLNTDYGMYKINENTLAINTGPHTPGIQIQKKGDGFIVCNNLTADQSQSNISPEQLKSTRENNLLKILVLLKQQLQAEPKQDKTLEQEKESQKNCSIQ